MNHAPTPAETHGAPLPELSVSDSMRAAARSVAAGFHAYQTACYDLPKARQAGAIPANLQSQRERKQAYHLALKFLATATLKENPAYGEAAWAHLEEPARGQMQALLERYLDGRLNTLIREVASGRPELVHQADHHPVMRGPW